MREKLILLLADPKNIGRLCEIIGNMPNIKTSTFGGPVCWRDLASHKGWRMQRNIFTRHCRILDPDDYRIAWGSERAMQSALNRLEIT